MTDLNNAPPGPAAVSLQASLTEMVRESQKLRADVHNAEELRAVKIAQIRKENRINLVLIAVLAASMVLVLAVAYRTNQIAQDTKRNADAITDCTIAGGKCYEEGQRRTGVAIQAINLTQLYVFECSRLLPVAANPPGPEFDRRFEACVQARLAKAKVDGRLGGN